MSSVAAASPQVVPLRSAAHRSWVVAATFLATDFISITVACSIAVLGRFAIKNDYALSFYFSLAPAIAVFLMAFALSDLYPAIALSPVAEIQRICRSITVTFLFMISVSFFLRDVELYSRAALLIAWILCMGAVIVGRMACRHFLAPKQWWGAPAIVLGSLEAAGTVARQIQRHAGLGLKVVGVLAENRGSFGTVPYLGGFDQASSLADRYGVRYCIVAMPGIPAEQLTRVVEQYASRFRSVLIIPDLFGIASQGVNARDIGGILGLEVRQRLLDIVPRFIKRTLDLLTVGIGVVILIPLFAVIWLAVRISSPGAAIYSHPRMSPDGGMFMMLKFRTMVTNGQEVLERYLATNREAAIEWSETRKLKDDPRLTPVGRLLRKTSFDELPQLFNVLRGEMSIIGPRPIPQSEAPRYSGRLYSRVRPGITGLWQVSGRNNTTYEERIFFDEYYVRNWSIWLDLYILSRTVKVVLTGEGAY